jgi:hypothetical protein
MKPLSIILLALVLTGCAEPSVVQATTPPYGFWYGLWHGMIAPIAFIASLFSDTIAVYGVNNNGAWYDLGFLLAVGGYTIRIER